MIAFAQNQWDLEFNPEPGGYEVLALATTCNDKGMASDRPTALSLVLAGPRITSHHIIKTAAVVSLLGWMPSASTSQTCLLLCVV